MDAEMVSVSFEGRRVSLLKFDVTIFALEKFFGIEKAGAHLKAKKEGSSSCLYENIYPRSNGSFCIPNGCSSLILVAMKNEDAEGSSSFDTTNRTMASELLSVGRRGNSAIPSSTSHAISPLQVMSRARSPLVGAGGDFKVGPRPVPSIWGARGKKRKTVQETKAFRLTYMNAKEGQMEDMWEIPIDLTSLQDDHGLYTVYHVAEQVEQQLGEEAKLVITDIKGNPIRDMSTTRGHAFWNAQKVFRAFYANNFSEWKPLVWESIKSDYGFKDKDFSPSNATQDTINVVSGIQSSQDQSLNAKVEKILKLVQKEEEAKSLREVFQCSICLQTSSNLMSACTSLRGCGRLLGCFTCFYNIQRCPFCRKYLQLKIDRQPLIIPGLSKILGVPEITLKTAMSQVQGSNPTRSSSLQTSDIEDEDDADLERSVFETAHDEPQDEEDTNTEIE